MFSGTSLLAQWLRILLPIQGAQVQSLVFEDFTGYRAKKPICHNDWVCAPNYLSHSGSRARAPQQGSGLCWPQLQKGFTQQRRPSTAKKKKKKKSSHILHGHKLLTQNRWLIKFFVFLPLPHNCSWKCTLLLENFHFHRYQILKSKGWGKRGIFDITSYGYFMYIWISQIS